MMLIFFFKQKTAYEMRISDWSSDVCSSDLLAAEFAQLGVRVNAVAPGEIETAMLSPEYDQLIPRIPMHRLGTPEEVASAVFGLCSKDFSRSEERRVGKECVVRVDLGGRRIIQKQNKDIKKINNKQQQ